MATLNSYRAYSNVKIAEEDPNKQANTAEVMVYIGLELATSFITLVSQCVLNYIMDVFLILPFFVQKQLKSCGLIRCLVAIQTLNALWHAIGLRKYVLV